MSDSESVTSVVEQMEQGGGNTKLHQKRVSQSEYWCFTYNNYTSAEMEQLVHRLQQDDIRGYIFQEEVGDGTEGDSASGTPHLQGYFEFTAKGRWSQLKLDSNRCHFEKRKGTRAQNLAYCSKERTWIGTKKQFSPNFKPKRPLKVLSEAQLRPWQKGIIADIGNDADDRTLNWFWSEAGNVGKTTFCKYLSHKYGAIALGGKAADCRMGVVTYLQEHGDTPEIVLIPIPRSFDPQYVSYEAMENIKDMYFYSGKYEGGMVNGNCPHVFVFSNFHPDLSKMSEDRWNVVQIDASAAHVKDFVTLEDSYDRMCTVTPAAESRYASSPPPTKRARPS